MARIKEPHKTPSRTSVMTVESVRGEAPWNEMRVRVKKTTVAQIRTLVGRRTTAKAARQRDARSDQRLFRTGEGLGFSLAVWAAPRRSQGQ